MKGKLIAVAYTLRTYWNQFSMGGLCKQEKMHQFDNSHNSFLWPEYFIDYFCENGFHVRLWHPSCVYFSTQRQYTALQKNAYTSEITFLALVPCVHAWYGKLHFQLPFQYQFVNNQYLSGFKYHCLQKSIVCSGF